MGSRSYFTYKGRECAESGFADRAIAELAKHHVGSFSLESAQLYAWQQELGVLRQVALAYPECTIALEYMIPRMGKRVDAMVLQASLTEDQQARNAEECKACRESRTQRSCNGCPAKKTKKQIEAEVRAFVQGASRPLLRLGHLRFQLDRERQLPGQRETGRHRATRNSHRRAPPRS